MVGPSERSWQLQELGERLVQASGTAAHHWVSQPCFCLALNSFYNSQGTAALFFQWHTRSEMRRTKGVGRPMTAGQYFIFYLRLSRNVYGHAEIAARQQATGGPMLSMLQDDRELLLACPFGGPAQVTCTVASAVARWEAGMQPQHLLNQPQQRQQPSNQAQHCL